MTFVFQLLIRLAGVAEHGIVNEASSELECESMKRRAAVLLAALLIPLVNGCSTFNRDWKAAAAGPTTANGIEGRWEGTWSSQTNGHHGRLRCLLGKSADTQYQARFHANFWKVFSYGYAIPLTIKQANATYKFQGDADLGWLAGGRYHYEGQASQSNFFSTYKASADGGVFEMKRPGQSAVH